jgi:hypothetical protein
MAEFLSQDEIDALLDIGEEDEIETDFGSPDFEKLTETFNKAFHPKMTKTIEDDITSYLDGLLEEQEQEEQEVITGGGYIPKIQGYNPKDMLDSLKYEEEYFEKTAENYKLFKKYHKKFKEIADEQPEIFI